MSPLPSEPEGLAFVAVAEILIILDFLPAEDVGFSSTLEGSFDAPLSDTDDSELELLDSSSFSLDAEAAEGFTSASGFLSPFSSSSSSGLDCTELSVVLGVDADGDESDFSPLSFFFEPAVSITSAGRSVLPAHWILLKSGFPKR